MNKVIKKIIDWSWFNYIATDFQKQILTKFKKFDKLLKVKRPLMAHEIKSKYKGRCHDILEVPN